jgi:biopolymer transport protein ExbB
MNLPMQDPAAASAVPQLDSVYDMIVAGGPVMIPLALASVVGLGVALERVVRTRRRRLGTEDFEAELLAALRAGGVSRGQELCEQRAHPTARVLRVALSHWNAQFGEREKRVEDAGHREVRALTSKLRPLVYVSMLAPLLGFLGTVYGMIIAFITVALHEGLGRPELLASGISQALITTAAGLTIAIPVQVLYYWMKSRVERFAREVEEVYVRVSEQLAAGLPPAPPPPRVEPERVEPTPAAAPAV